MATTCRCKYFIKILNNCCFCINLRYGTLLIGCIFLVWYFYLTFGSAFMMECIFPNEYQRAAYGAPAALKTTMVFSAFGFITSAMLCIGVHYNNELMFLPFLAHAPLWIIAHILALICYRFVWVVIILFLITMGFLVYCWLVVYSYHTELRYAYEDELPPPIGTTRRLGQ